MKSKLILPPGGDIDLTVLGVNEEASRRAPRRPCRIGFNPRSQGKRSDRAPTEFRINRY